MPILDWMISVKVVWRNYPSFLHALSFQFHICSLRQPISNPEARNSNKLPRLPSALSALPRLKSPVRLFLLPHSLLTQSKPDIYNTNRIMTETSAKIRELRAKTSVLFPKEMIPFPR